MSNDAQGSILLQDASHGHGGPLCSFRSGGICRCAAMRVLLFAPTLCSC